MNHKYISPFLIYLISTISILAGSNNKELKSGIDLRALSLEDAERILMKIKSDDNTPDTQIKNAFITIVDDNYITAEIKCDTLIKNNRKPTLLKGNVMATFYKDGDPVSILYSDFAEYQQKISLIAKKNITIHNLDSTGTNKDLLFFKDQKTSMITWFESYGRIKSDNEFTIKTKEGCTTGSSFESNVDLSQMKILNSKGNKDCK